MLSWNSPENRNAFSKGKIEIGKVPQAQLLLGTEAGCLYGHRSGDAAGAGTCISRVNLGNTLKRIMSSYYYVQSQQVSIF